MASALQCPACGYKHRLSGLSGDPLFTCSHCGRLLKTPAEYRRPEPSGPAEAPRPGASARVQRGGSARRDQTSVLPAPPSRGTPPQPARPKRPAATVALPLRILAWVAAVAISAYVVRWCARVTGWLTGDSIIDVITGSGIGRYFRLFALVPFWALAAAGLATLFIEGGRWWSLRRHGVGRPVTRPATVKVPPAKAAPTAKRPAPPRRPEPAAPAPRTDAREPSPERQPAPPAPPAANPAAAETRSPTGAAGSPRPRRIPRRDVNS